MHMFKQGSSRKIDKAGAYAAAPMQPMVGYSPTVTTASLAQAQMATASLGPAHMALASFAPAQMPTVSPAPAQMAPAPLAAPSMRAPLRMLPDEEQDEQDDDEETEADFPCCPKEEDEQEHTTARGIALLADRDIDAKEILRDPVQFDRMTFLGACIFVAGLQFLPTALFHKAGVSMHVCLILQWIVFWLLTYIVAYFTNMVSYSGNVWLHAYPAASAIILGAMCIVGISDVTFARASKTVAKTGGTVIALMVTYPFSAARSEMIWCGLLFIPVMCLYMLGRSILLNHPNVGWAATLFAQLPTLCKLTMQNLSTSYISKYKLVPRRWINLQSVSIICLVYVSRIMSLCVLPWWGLGGFVFNAALCLMFDVLDGQVMFDRAFHCIATSCSKPRPPFVMPTMIEALVIAMIEWSKAPLIMIVVYWVFNVASLNESKLWNCEHIAKAATYICVVQPLFLGIDWLIDKKIWGNWKSDTRMLVDANKYGQHKQSAAYEKEPDQLDETGERRFKGFPKQEHKKILGISHDTWAHIYIAYVSLLMIDNVVSMTMGWCESSRVEEFKSLASCADAPVNATLDVLISIARADVEDME